MACLAPVVACWAPGTPPLPLQGGEEAWKLLKLEQWNGTTEAAPSLCSAANMQMKQQISCTCDMSSLVFSSTISSLMFSLFSFKHGSVLCYGALIDEPSGKNVWQRLLIKKQ